MAIFILFASLKSLALPTDQLQTGDIILLDLDCYSCRLIEEQTGGPYSHSGIVLKYGTKFFVAQSLGSVHHVPLQAFLGFSQKPVQVMRPKNLNFAAKNELLDIYQNQFLGLPFDHDYVWDDEKLYCSEFIYKLLSSVYAFENFRPLPMSFDKNPAQWRGYFGGEPPTGKLGLSPNDFYYSSDFKDMGLLY